MRQWRTALTLRIASSDRNPRSLHLHLHDLASLLRRSRRVHEITAQILALALHELSNRATAFMIAAPVGAPSEAANLESWQFSFNRLDDLPGLCSSPVG